ncbi:hypothetical protein VP150E351_P0214 [Vibrio phage 150E35-1]|nr:hypothetical protein VP150E351_P0214 [Vibrio phage 150E35-1]
MSITIIWRSLSLVPVELIINHVSTSFYYY